MTDAIKDGNRAKVVLGRSYSDGVVTPLKIDSTNNGLVIDTTNTIAFTPSVIASRDGNHEPVMMAVSSTDGTLHPVVLNASNGGLLVDMT